MPDKSPPVPKSPVVFLVDIDNTLLDNDRIQADLKEHIEREFGPEPRDRYWAILERLFDTLGYRDYLGALQQYRVENRHAVKLLALSFFLVDYPFAKVLYPGALEVLKRLKSHAPTVILSDGDVVFQPRKAQQSGIWDTVDGHVLIYIHKEQELEDVERRYPAEHYVLIDDKPRILTSVKKIWGPRVTTVFPKQGMYAHDPAALAGNFSPDVTIEHIGDLLPMDLAKL
ncbi:MAG TPA: HAD family hydrolase [Planctomycetaceae bacterium]|nr:HAD family hydrolase [Planctomycetaceae bacterium]